MKDWFYAPGDEVVSAESSAVKNQVVKAIKSGYKTISQLEKKLEIKFAETEIEDVKYLIRVYGPLSYDNQSGCRGCDICVSKTSS